MGTFNTKSSIETTTTDSISSYPIEGKGAKNYAVDLLKQMRKSSVLPLNTYKEIVRFFISEFNDLPYLSQENELIKAKCRYGNPERTVAKLKEHDNIVLPLLTISQDTVIETSDREKFGALIMQTSYWDEEKQRAIRVVSYADRPITINYKINIWTKYMEDMDQLAQQVRLAFTPSLQLYTPVTKSSQAFLVSESNNYAFALADKEDRVIRKTFTTSVETYIRSPKYMITSTGKVEELKIQLDIS